MATTLYCSLADIQNRLSADGVTYRTDDGPPTQYGDALDDASRLIDEYCLGRYTEANLGTSGWVKHRCAEIAAYLLCERRGNPPPMGIARKYARCEERLEMVRTGKLAIPDLPGRKGDVPVVSQPSIQMWPYPHTRIERSKSTGTPEGYVQRVDYFDILDFVI